MVSLPWSTSEWEETSVDKKVSKLNCLLMLHFCVGWNAILNMGGINISLILNEG